MGKVLHGIFIACFFFWGITSTTQCFISNGYEYVSEDQKIVSGTLLEIDSLEMVRSNVGIIDSIDQSMRRVILTKKDQGSIIKSFRMIFKN
ncbi:MAG: hypothetical protein ACKOFB_06680, partial [bacterium]